MKQTGRPFIPHLQSSQPHKEAERTVQDADSTRLIQALEEGAKKLDFRPLLEGFRSVFCAHGIDADRIQIPMIKPLGFRHPTIWGVLLTWNRHQGFANTSVMTHDDAAEAGIGNDKSFEDDLASAETPRNPYGFVHGEHDWFFSCALDDPPHDFSIFRTLQDEGMRHYACFRLNMPAVHLPAVVSLSAANPFPADLRARLDGLRSILGMACYGAYRTSQAHKIASTYVGPTTGPRVLDGQIVRGSSETIEAGVMFCDVRGFTALSRKVGTDIIQIMNRLFEVIGDEAHQRGGEILKFIGDAMLLVYPLDGRQPEDVATMLIDTVNAAHPRVAAVAKETGHDLGVGFGCHIGEVIYGNVGTPERLDFTVMGPAVNLASRLESCCKQLGTHAVFSSVIQELAPQLQRAGEQDLKGIDGPTPVWVLPRS